MWVNTQQHQKNKWSKDTPKRQSSQIEWVTNYQLMISNRFNHRLVRSYHKVIWKENRKFIICRLTIPIPKMCSTVSLVILLMLINIRRKRLFLHVVIILWLMNWLLIKRLSRGLDRQVLRLAKMRFQFKLNNIHSCSRSSLFLKLILNLENWKLFTMLSVKFKWWWVQVLGIKLRRRSNTQLFINRKLNLLIRNYSVNLLRRILKKVLNQVLFICLKHMKIFLLKLNMYKNQQQKWISFNKLPIKLFRSLNSLWRVPTQQKAKLKYNKSSRKTILRSQKLSKIKLKKQLKIRLFRPN